MLHQPHPNKAPTPNRPMQHNLSPIIRRIPIHSLPIANELHETHGIIRYLRYHKLLVHRLL